MGQRPAGASSMTTANAYVLIASLALGSTAGAQGIEPRPTLTPESIRRAIVSMDIDAGAADTQSDTEWRVVRNLKDGAESRVILDDQRVLRGRFRGADEQSITLQINAVNRTMPRAQVQQVAARGVTRASNARTWGMIGTFGGLGVGIASCRGKEGECIQGAPLTGMLIGWLAGTIVGGLLPSWKPIYSARP